jgi:hypothetical protein
MPLSPMSSCHASLSALLMVVFSFHCSLILDTAAARGSRLTEEKEDYIHAARQNNALRDSLYFSN